MRADCLPFAHVTVRVNGRALDEYETQPADEENPIAATTYIESVAGAEFSVHLLLEPGFAYNQDDLNFAVAVDGKMIAGNIVNLSFAATRDISSEVAGAFEGSNRSGITMRKLVFAAHEITDEKPKASLDPKAIAKLGDIEVTLRRCRKTGLAEETSAGVDFRATGKESIPEKALKGRAISNHAELGSATRVISTFVTTTYPYGRKPIATYTFKYRSHKDLQIEGVIPRSPSPVPLEERDPGTLTQEEARELIVRMRAKEQNAVKIKQEFKCEKRRISAISAESDDQNDEEGDISITGVFDRRKRARPENTIDLTADD